MEDPLTCADRLDCVCGTAALELRAQYGKGAAAAPGLLTWSVLTCWLQPSAVDQEITVSWGRDKKQCQQGAQKGVPEVSTFNTKSSPPINGSV